MMLIMRLHKQHQQGNQLHSLQSAVCKMFLFHLCHTSPILQYVYVQ